MAYVEELEISRGLLPGVIGAREFGRNTNVVVPADIWPNGGNWIPPSAAVKHNIKSTSLFTFEFPPPLKKLWVWYSGGDSNSPLLRS